MKARDIWRWIRQATGDDAYERYVEHRTRKHPGEPVLTRRAFYEESQQRKWSGVSRCC
jgi:uncharacterized short protein YbdD (DUF466 family)